MSEPRPAGPASDEHETRSYPGARRPDRTRRVDSSGVGLAVHEWGDARPRGAHHRPRRRPGGRALARDVRPPDYVRTFAWQASALSGLDIALAVVAANRPPWLAEVASQPGVVESDLVTIGSSVAARVPSVAEMDRFQYLGLLAACLILTLPLEFVFRARVYGRPRRLIRALAAPVAVFVVWDLVAIARGHWTFTERYVTGWDLPGSLPVEEFAFFVVIPICALLTFEASRRTLKR